MDDIQQVGRPENGLGSWTNRRRFMWFITFFCMGCVMYVLLKGTDTQVNQAVIMWSFLCMGGIVGSYVFGAAWQDISFHKNQQSEDK